MNIVDTSISKKIVVSDGKETHSLSFSDFYNKLALPLKLKEKGKYATNDDINKLIQELDGFKEVFIKEGVLMQSVK